MGRDCGILGADIPSFSLPGWTWKKAYTQAHAQTRPFTPSLLPPSFPHLLLPPHPNTERFWFVLFFCQRLPASFCPWDTLACSLDVEQPTNNTCQLPIYWPDEKKKSSAVRLQIIPTCNQSVVWAHWAVNLLSKWLRIFHFKCLRQWCEERVLASKASEQVSWLMWMFPWNPNFYTKCCLLKTPQHWISNFLTRVDQRKISVSDSQPTIQASN